MTGPRPMPSPNRVAKATVSCWAIPTATTISTGAKARMREAPKSLSQGPTSIPSERLIRQIEAVSRIDEADRNAVQALEYVVRSVDQGSEIFREGQTVEEFCLILSGVACGSKIIGGGRRQILSL